jgi:hypothetical protein
MKGTSRAAPYHLSLTHHSFCRRISPGYASGGFISDTRAGKIISGSQQQFISRNLDIEKWDGSVWNILFMGVKGAPDDSNYPHPPFTTLEAVPTSREKPYIFIVDDIYFVSIPSVATNTSGISWNDDTKQSTDKVIPISDFLIASPTTSIEQINSEISNGKHLLFVPGVYNITETIFIAKSNTVVLGLGLATLTAIDGVTPLVIADSPGIIIAGLTIDAGETESNVLLQVGPRGTVGSGDINNPTTILDVFFRVGGAHVGKANICLEVNSNYVLLDHIWVWRADHGIEGFDETDGFDGDNERWSTNIGRVGVVVNGNYVTGMGLFVEHYQEHNLIWNGNGGKVFLFQCELPYDPPTQNDWMSPDGSLGWSGYKVNNSVIDHELWAGGVYCYNRNNPKIQTKNGFEFPIGKPGIHMNRVFTKNLSGPGVIKAVINGIGEQADETDPGPHYIISP